VLDGEITQNDKQRTKAAAVAYFNIRLSQSFQEGITK
jgi:hypothetical protein